MNLQEYYKAIEGKVQEAVAVVAPIATEVAQEILTPSPVVQSVEKLPQVQAALAVIHSKVDSVLAHGTNVNNTLLSVNQSLISFFTRLESLEAKVQQIHEALYPPKTDTPSNEPAQGAD